MNDYGDLGRGPQLPRRVLKETGTKSGRFLGSSFSEILGSSYLNTNARSLPLRGLEILSFQILSLYLFFSSLLGKEPHVAKGEKRGRCGMQCARQDHPWVAPDTIPGSLTGMDQILYQRKLRQAHHFSTSSRGPK